MTPKSLLLISFCCLVDVEAESLDVQCQQLDAQEFAVREAAQEVLQTSLLRDPKQVSEALFQYYHANESPEVRTRIELLLQKSEWLKEQVIHAKFGPEQGFVGISMLNGKRAINGKEQGVVVVNTVHPGSPAEQMGVLAGDAIWKIDSTLIGAGPNMAQQDFHQYVTGKSAGDRVTLHLFRGETGLKITVTLIGRGAALKGLGLTGEDRRLALEKDTYFEQWLESQLRK